MMYRPGCRTVPGTSTAPEKVTVVRLSHALAFIDGANTEMVAAQVIATANRRILFMIHGLLTSSFCSRHGQTYADVKASGLPCRQTTQQINQLGDSNGHPGEKCGVYFLLHR